MPTKMHGAPNDDLPYGYTDEQFHEHLLFSDCSECSWAGRRFSELVKAEKQPEEQRVIGVAAVLYDGDDVLLQRRAKNPGYGLYVLAGGKLEASEVPEMAIRREVREELGVTLMTPIVDPVYFALSNGALMLYYMVAFSRHRGTERNMEPDKCHGLYWVKREALPVDMWQGDRAAVQVVDSLLRIQKRIA